jgi:hypothetical protein
MFRSERGPGRLPDADSRVETAPPPLSDACALTEGGKMRTLVLAA